MALTSQQKQDLKKHLKQPPTTTVLDSLFSVLEDGGVMEADFVAAITACNDALDAIETAEGEVDEIVEGGGARFNHQQRLAVLHAAYRREVKELARQLSWTDGLDTGRQITGFFSI